MTTRKKWPIGLLALALSWPLGCSTNEQPFVRPNVLLISIDTLRADALGCYGSPFSTSPNIDALAARGVLCEDPTSTTSWTLPSHLSMLSGLSISAHGICDERIWAGANAKRMDPLRGEFLSEVLGRAGYSTGGIYSWKYLEPEFGFGAGFDSWRRMGDTVWSDPIKGARYEKLRAEGQDDELRAWAAEKPGDFDMQAPLADQIVDAGIDWIDQRDEAPFFLFMHIFDVHNDYVPPAPFDTAFSDGYEGPVDGRRIEAANSPIHGGMPARDLEQVRRLYHGEVAWVDSQLGRLFAALEERGLAEDTLIILTSDHGEEFFEHGEKTHRKQLLRESVEVPLIFSWPGHLPSGTRVPGPVGIIDIVPTVAALADVAPPTSVSGRNLTQVLEGDAPNDDVTYLTELLRFKDDDSLPDRQTGLRRGDKHWIRTITPEGDVSGVFYDLATNPTASGPGKGFGAGSPEMQAFHGLLDQVRTSTTGQRAQAPQRANQTTDAHSAQETQNELAGMGYAGGALPAEVRHSSLLCLDGCIVPQASPK